MGKFFAERVIIQAQTFQSPCPITGNKDIRRLEDLIQDGLAFIFLEVESNTPLVHIVDSVERITVFLCRAGHCRTCPAPGIAESRLDFDDIRPPVSEDPGCARPRYEISQIDHFNTF